MNPFWPLRRFPLVAGLCGLLVGATHGKATELVPVDLTSPSPGSTKVMRTSEVVPQISLEPAPRPTTPVANVERSEESGNNSARSATVDVSPEVRPRAPRTIRLQLREFKWLRQAAQEAGGDVVISIRPVNITGEDLIVPLLRQGNFQLAPSESDSVVLVQSQSVEVPVQKLRAEIQQLESRRRLLLQDLHWLESEPHEVPLESESATSPLSLNNPPPEPLLITLSPNLDSEDILTARNSKIAK